MRIVAEGPETGDQRLVEFLLLDCNCPENSIEETRLRRGNRFF